MIFFAKTHGSTVILKNKEIKKKKRILPNKCRKSDRIRESLYFNPYCDNRFRQVSSADANH